jgi:putative addiction module component (TIGR02574 family)
MALQLSPQIEKSIEALPYDEQLKLIERLVHRLRKKLPTNSDQQQSEFERQLATMASDPQIQAELQAIEIEFAGTENDGLEKL